MSTLTDEEVMERLRHAGGIAVEAADFLHSRDALQPVLSVLSETEWVALGQLLCEGLWTATGVGTTGNPLKSYGDLKFLLTLDPATLARAVAGAIGAKEDA